MRLKIAELKAAFAQIEKQYDQKGQVNEDPVGRVLQFDNLADREVAALISAVFAYGNVAQIKTTLNLIFEITGPSLAKTLMTSSGQDWKTRIPKSFRHRFNSANDLGLLLTWLGEALRRNGSLEDFFLAGSAPPSNIAGFLEDFVTRFTDLPCHPYKKPKSRGALFFFPRPSGKSACKRLLLFLRWMVGSGPMDVGQWKNMSRSDLLIPVDTHVLRISRHLGFTKRKDNSWKTALEITEALRALDPLDPTRFDFALCHLGISKECPSRFDLRICRDCRMNHLCLTFARAQ